MIRQLSPLLIFLATVASGQSYWQQEILYRIEVSLDDVNHRLNGQLSFSYINHSPDTLHEIFIHLWANAFGNSSTAFARQQLRQGEQRFYFSGPEERGGYSGLAFEAGGQPAKWAFSDESAEIAVIRLHRPLATGDSVLIRSPFSLKIPESFSRLGHVGESYQMTQWFPKPAVYDHQGWHPMPYLDQGEFYADFGSFDIRITLPENYVVGATGVLQTESERQFMEQRAAETTGLLSRDAERYNSQEPFPASGPRLKTIRFTADHVHDFAWFADKRFKVQKSLVVLPSGRAVETWALFTRYEQHLWKEAIHFVDRSVRFYSEAVGEYPYPQATVVQSALSAGAGMEYPMITVIGYSGNAAALDEVITHEIGHNWFYGALASNERQHPWLDEGINTYYEQRYIRQFYGENRFSAYVPDIIQGRSEMTPEELVYLYQARLNRDQAPDTPSGELSEINYVIGAYQKPAAAFRYLEAYLGTERFDALMQGFYNEWKFRHPYPSDLRDYLELHSGKNLSWLFDGMLASSVKMDYVLQSVTPGRNAPFMLTVRNRGEINAPFSLSAFRNGEIIASRWYEGFFGTDTVGFPAGDYDHLTLDAARLAPELYRQNNHLRLNTIFPRLEPLQISLLPRIEDDRRTQLFLFPLAGWNSYDKAMAGIVLYNTTAPSRKLEFALAPLFGFGSRDLNGLGRVAWHLDPGGKAVQSVTLGLGARGFSYRYNDRFDYHLRYTRLMPYVELELGKKATSTYTQRLGWRTLWINEQRAGFQNGDFSGRFWEDTFIHELSYNGENRRAVNPHAVYVALEQQSYPDINGSQHYLRASLEGNYSLSYRQRRSIDLRFFAGGFLINTQRNGGRLFPGAFNLIAQGYNDYRYDELFTGRTDNDGFRSQQVSLREGAFKTPVGSAFSLGRSNNFILALNLKADLPMDFPLLLPIKPFFDIGYFDNAQPTGLDDAFRDQLLWSAGLALDLFDGLAGIYFPLLNSKNLRDRLEERGNFWTRVSFSIDFRRINPFDLVRKGVF